MQLWVLIKMLAEADLKTVLLAMINPVYGPMILIATVALILEDIQGLFGKH